MEILRNPFNLSIFNDLNFKFITGSRTNSAWFSPIIARMGELFNPFHLLILFIIAVPILGIHFLPAIIAGVRHARNFWWILAVTFFLSWTIVGWIIALIWAIRDEPRYDVPSAQPQSYNL